MAKNDTRGRSTLSVLVKGFAVGFYVRGRNCPCSRIKSVGEESVKRLTIVDFFKRQPSGRDCPIDSCSNDFSEKY